MNFDEVLSEVSHIFGSVLKQPDLKLTRETVAKDVNGWTSLNNMLLIEAIETHYKIKFKLNEIMKFKNVGEFVDAIIRKLG